MLDFLRDDPSGQDGSCCHPDRSQRSTRNYHAGHAAEANVLRYYLEKGCELLAQRWRKSGGEIDLIFRDGPQYVFVEVKAARTFDAALARITPRQVQRIYASAEAYLARVPEGLLAEMRFDAGLVDGQGRVRVMESALLPY